VYENKTSLELMFVHLLVLPRPHKRDNPAKTDIVEKITFLNDKNHKLGCPCIERLHKSQQFIESDFYSSQTGRS
jgi:hypothetical protein